MAIVNKSGTPSLSSQLPPQNCQIASGALAGEDIAAGDVCYVASDGTVMRSDGTAADAAAVADGIAAKAASEGEAVTILRNVTFKYGAGLTPGTRLYVAATAGAIGDAATTGGTAPIGFVVDDTRIYFHGSYY